jgi:hypothetical protein
LQRDGGVHSGGFRNAVCGIEHVKHQRAELAAVNCVNRKSNGRRGHAGPGNKLAAVWESGRRCNERVAGNCS